MLSLRRYGWYLVLAVCIILTLNYLRQPLRERLSTTAQAQLDRVLPGPKVQPDPEDKPVDSAKDQPVPDNTPAASPKGSFRWDQVKVHYPVESLTPLPSAAPRKLPKVQFDFKEESATQSAERRRRQDLVKQTFERCWTAYREHAWMRDELAPLSGGAHESFGGWAANLVDNLDNLWIMGMKDQFEDAVSAAMNIDLGSASIDIVNVFETTIRHLGGFLSAYDLSRDPRCLEKAKEFGEMLLKAFDTPNRLPITRWDPKAALTGPQVAHEHVLVAEIGSLTMEFTRLSQVTGDHRWYDAVERIMTLFDHQQDQTNLPGMWPVTVNAKDANFTMDSFFTLSAMSDSLYEYFPKMHALLGGVDPRYKKMYDISMATAIQHNIFRPMTPENADILVSGNVHKESRDGPAILDAQGQHLGCFSGGMFALGGKLFSDPTHLQIGRKLTEGCIWAYKAMPLGIMPEVFQLVACESTTSCEWSTSEWQRGVARDMETIDVDLTISAARLPPGFTKLNDRRYILRPEAIESVFLLYRMTGEAYFQDVAWDMFEAITRATTTPIANAALQDISVSWAEIEDETQIQVDSMESFWMAETLKYFYLIFSEPGVIDLDEWMFNTEAHPLRRPTA